MRERRSMIWASLLTAATCGCGSVLDELGTCPSPLEPIDLNGVFAMAVVVYWDGDSIELTDAAQPDVAAFYAEHLGGDVIPWYSLNARFFDLGPMSAGELLEVEFLSHVVYSAQVYDGEFIRLAFGATHDFEGKRHVLQIPIARQSHTFFLRLNLDYLSESGNPIVRLTRTTRDDTPDRRPQSVVLDFSGQTGVVYRWGNLLPTDVAPLDDFAAREAAIQAFKEVFAGFNLTVFTDTDPTPAEPFSIIYIGAASPTFEPEALAYAEFEDGLNQFQDDIAVVDVNSDGFRLARLCGSTVFGTLIGNSAAHEMGHLLGLGHVRDPDALMSGLSCVNLLDRRERRFKRAPLYWRTGDDPGDWVLGYQDPVRYLADILGPAEGAQP